MIEEEVQKYNCPKCGDPMTYKGKGRDAVLFYWVYTCDTCWIELIEKAERPFPIDNKIH